jgi:hypothetical protein
MKKPLLAVVAVLLVLVGILLTLLLPRPSKVTRANFERIEVGMSKPEVEEILGGPPGDYRDRPTYTHARVDFLLGLVGAFAPGREERGWHGNQGVIEVTFDGPGVVAEKQFTEETPAGWAETLRWRLNRRWERLWGRGGP